jgi:hypothetical protein
MTINIDVLKLTSVTFRYEGMVNGDWTLKFIDGTERKVYSIDIETPRVCRILSEDRVDQATRDLLWDTLPSLLERAVAMVIGETFTDDEWQTELEAEGEFYMNNGCFVGFKLTLLKRHDEFGNETKLL